MMQDNAGPLAQLAEQRTFNPRVVGSSPTGPTKYLVRAMIGLNLQVEPSLYPHFMSNEVPPGWIEPRCVVGFRGILDVSRRLRLRRRLQYRWLG